MAEDRVTVEMDSDETLCIMKAVNFYLRHLSERLEVPGSMDEIRIIKDVVSRLYPQISRYAARERQLRLDGRN